MELFESVILMGLGLSIGYFAGTLFYRRRLKKTLMAMRNLVAKGDMAVEHYQAALSLNGVGVLEPLAEFSASFDVLSSDTDIEALEAEQESLLDAVTA